MLTASLSSTSSSASSALGTAMMMGMDMEAGRMAQMAGAMMNMNGDMYQAPSSARYPAHHQALQAQSITPAHPAELHLDLLHHDPQAHIRSFSNSAPSGAEGPQQVGYMAGMDQTKYEPSLAQPTLPLVLME